MSNNKDFMLKQARYDLMQYMEILFNKKDISRISIKVPYSELLKQTEKFIKVVLSHKDRIISVICKSDTLDDYTIGHSVNVCMLSILIGDLMEFKGKRLTELAVSALLHDIGKRMIPKDITFKNERLTDDEFAIMKQHPQKGVDFIKEVYPEASDAVLNGILQHHERMDGSGYPDKISWYDVSDFGRIIGIADVYEAFTALRSYHEKRTIEEGVRCICTTGGLDQNIVRLFTQNTVFYPKGMYVVLSDQTVAVVDENTVGDCPVIVTPGSKQYIDTTEKKIVAVL